MLLQCVVDADYGKPSEQDGPKRDVRVFIVLEYDCKATEFGTVRLCEPAGGAAGGLQRTGANQPLDFDEGYDYLPIRETTIVDEIGSHLCNCTMIMNDEVPKLVRDLYKGGMYAWDRRAKVPGHRRALNPSSSSDSDPLLTDGPIVLFNDDDREPVSLRSFDLQAFRKDGHLAAGRSEHRCTPLDLRC